MRLLWNLRAWVLRAVLVLARKAPEKGPGMGGRHEFRFGPWPSDKYVYWRKIHVPSALKIVGEVAVRQNRNKEQ